MALTTSYVLLSTFLVYRFIFAPLFVDSRSRIPGPSLYAISKWRLAFDDWRGSRTRTIQELHRIHGSAVRIGPNEVHFNSLTALRSIYGAGSGYERTWFYSMFDVYGKPNLFTFHSPKHHADRKKLLANAYSKSSMMKITCTRLVERKVREYMDYVDALAGQPDNVFDSLHYFSIDTITHFVYGSHFGATSAMAGNTSDRALLNDILDPSRRRLSWFAVHLPTLTKWLYTRIGMLGKIIRPFLPMQKPATYTGIRQHALRAWHDFKQAASTGEEEAIAETTIISLLWKHHVSQKAAGLEDMDIASECADHLLAGIDTTADTLMFLLWALSLPKNQVYQSKLATEVRQMDTSSMNEDNFPTVEAADKLPYLNAIIKETLRLYAPLPSTEPRSLPIDTTVDGYRIPANTVVGMSPHSLHRNSDVFSDPLVFNPNRWLEQDASKVAEMNKWFWAFSSGGRMCIGLHLAMAEMTTLVAAVYRKYSTSIAPGFEDCTPAITSRFELFFDETMPKIEEHSCMIVFNESGI